MPTYHFLNKETGEEFSEFMSISALDSYLAENAHLQQIPTAPAIVDPVSIGVTKPPSDFQKYVLGRIKNSVPGNQDIGRRFNIPKEF